MKTKSLAAAIACAALLGCTAAGPARAPQGNVTVAVQGVTIAGVTRVTAELSPAGITAELLQSGSAWVGTLVAPAGAQTLTLRAYAGTTLVGQGSSAVTVVAGQTASAQVAILDVAGPPPALDHGPLVTSLVASKTTAAPGEAVTLTATAVDPDGDPIAFEWTQTCTSGVFSSPTAASTTWSSAEPVGCTLVVTATSKALSSSAQVTVVVAGTGTGTIDVGGTLFPQPVIEAIGPRLFSPAGHSIWYSRTGYIACANCDVSTDGTIGKIYFPGQEEQFNLYYSGVDPLASDVAVGLTDDCGGQVLGSSGLTGSLGTGTSNAFYWRAPASSAVCMLTFTATSHGLSDAFTLAAVVQGCPDDNLANPTPAQARDLLTYFYDPAYPGGTPTYHYDDLYANDAGWFVFDTAPGTAFEITVTSTDAIPVELWRGSDRFTPSTLAASGMNRVQYLTAATVADAFMLVKVGPGTPASGHCGAPYAFDLHPAP